MLKIRVSCILKEIPRDAIDEIAKRYGVSLNEFSLRATGAFSVPTQERRKKSFFSGLRTYCKNKMLLGELGFTKIGEPTVKALAVF